MMKRQVSLYEAKTHLSALVEEAAEGEEIVIAKNGVPKARLVALSQPPKEPRKPANAFQFTYMAPDWNDPDPEFEKLFYGEE